MDPASRPSPSLQFRLRTMFALVTACAVALGIWTWLRQPDFDIEIRTGMGPDTPLGRAALAGRTAELAKLLKSKEIRVDEQDMYGRTALHWAGIGGKTEAFDYLRAQGAACDIRDDFGIQPSEYADPSRQTP